MKELTAHDRYLERQRIAQEQHIKRAALAQPVDAVNMNQECVYETAKGGHKWVGLTDEERADCWSSSAVQSAINIEQALKEKNT